MSKPGMTYDASDVYADLIEPRYAPIADALVSAAEVTGSDDVLELGAGTGLVTRLAAPLARTVLATDASREMLERARRSLSRDRALRYEVLDYATPFPYLDSTFSLVLSGLTYAQASSRTVAEIARVLTPGGRVALSMWGSTYHEKRLLNAALRSLGGGRFPNSAPGRTVERLRSGGFRSVRRVDADLSTRFDSIDEYIAYRRGFGRPGVWTRGFHERFLEAVRREASRATAPDGTFTLGWSVCLITARAPRRPPTILTTR